MCALHRPLLLVDVDGVISLFGVDPTAPPLGSFLLVDGIPHFVSGTAGALLRTLQEDSDLVWCTGWEECSLVSHRRRGEPAPERKPSSPA